jgi:phosphohistidine phosphatase
MTCHVPTNDASRHLTPCPPLLKERGNECEKIISMKTLYLIRHAKSSWEEPGVKDIDRPLMEKGIEKTQRVIDYFNQNNISTDLMISSPAVRAYATAKLIAKGIGYPVKNIKQETMIYEGYYDKILDVIYATPGEVNSLMIFGHNPTITHLANLFLDPGIDMLPTTGVVAISFDTDKWQKIHGTEPRKEFVIFPKMLK